MALPANYDKIVLRANLARGEFTQLDPSLWHGSTTTQFNFGHLPPDPSNADIATLIAAVKAGTCSVEYSVWPTSRAPEVAYPYVDLPDAFSFLHHIHPFHPTDGYKIGTAMVIHGEYEEDASTQRPRITSPADEIPTDYETNQGIIYRLSTDWYIGEGDSDSFAFLLAVSSTEELTPALLNAYTPARAMATWLETLRVAGSGSPVGTDYDNLTSYSGRNYLLVQGGGQPDITFAITDVTPTTEDGNIVELDLICDVSVGTYHRSRLSLALYFAQITVGGALQREKPERGGYNHPFRTSEVLFDDNDSLTIINGLATFKLQHTHDDAILRLALNSHGIIPHEDLPIFLGNLVLPTPAERPGYGEVHYAGSGATVRMQTPSRMAGYSGGARPFIIQNIGVPADGLYHVEDWNGDNVISLKPGEHAHFSFSSRPFGQGRVVGELPERRHILSEGAQGQASAPGYYSDGANWTRPIPTPGVDTAEIHDTDAFTVGTATSFSNGSGFTAGNVVLGIWYLRVDKAGELHFIQEVDVQVLAGATGNIPAGHETRLYLLRGGVLTLLEAEPQEELSGVDTSRRYRWEILDVMQAGDLILPMFSYVKSASMNPSHLDVTSFRRVARLKPESTLIYTP